MCLKFVLLAHLFQILCGSSLLASIYTEQELQDKGVIFRNGMHYCESLDRYVSPYKESEEVEQCAQSKAMQAVCLSSKNTRWLHSQCFCPAQNRHLAALPNYEFYYDLPRIGTPESDQLLESLAQKVKECGPFASPDTPFSRTVSLKPLPDFPGYEVALLPGQSNWDNDEDHRSQQGDPRLPTAISYTLQIPIGCHKTASGNLIIPNWDHLKKITKVMDSEIGFYEVDGVIKNRAYLENFIEGELPCAKIDPISNDATCSIHDYVFHYFGLLLYPPKIRKLAQFQTQHLLGFIDYFNKTYAELANQPHFRLLFQRLIEEQITRIDLASAGLTYFIYKNLGTDLDSIGLDTHESLENFLAKASIDQTSIHSYLMNITDGSNPICEKRSAFEFIISMDDRTENIFPSGKEADAHIYKTALKDYASLQKMIDPSFNEPIDLIPYPHLVPDKGLPSLVTTFQHHGLPTAYDLLAQRIQEIQSQCSKLYSSSQGNTLLGIKPIN